ALRLLVISGSARKASLSRKLAAHAASKAQQLGIEVESCDLRALDLPLYDGDIEEQVGVPEGAYTLQEVLARNDGLLLVTPEYNGFPTPLVINAFDWLSRIGEAKRARNTGQTGVAVVAGKPAALLSASPGALGGLRSANYLRQFLQMNFQMLVLPKQYALGRAHEAFDAQGALKEAAADQSVEAVLNAWATLARALGRSSAA
nr:NAD(P)H-dependent oxidoreductase [Burkholderiaceae bacterium]